MLDKGTVLLNDFRVIFCNHNKLNAISGLCIKQNNLLDGHHLAVPQWNQQSDGETFATQTLR